MKRHFKKIITTPKLAISIAIIIAIIAGMESSVIQNKMRVERLAKIATEQVSLGERKNYTPLQDLTLAFPIGGRIKDISVKIGDKVKAGAVLASLDSENVIGAINQAKGAYSAAQTAYDKLVNGTSTPDIEIAKVALSNAKNAYDNIVAGPDIEIAKVALSNAKNAYDNIVAGQKVLVANALSNMRNSGLVAVPTTNSTTTIISPIISGTYTGTEEGTYTIIVYGTGNGGYFSISGLESGNSTVSTLAVPLGTHGLYIQFPNNLTSNINNTWTVSIPNTQSSAYLSYYSAYQSALQNQTQSIVAAQGAVDAAYSAYQSALQNQTQSIVAAQGAVDAAQATLNQKQAGARFEDLAIAKAQVESTQGALQIAQAAYNNTIITAPVNGTITNILITAGQVATPNTPVIELLSQ